MPSIRELRVNLDITQKELGELAGVSMHTVFRLEAGRDVRRKSALAICQALGVSISQVEGIHLHSTVRAHSKMKER